MLVNISEFISFHNANIQSEELFANSERLTAFASSKNIALEDISIEKHRMHFINWCTSLDNLRI